MVFGMSLLLWFQDSAAQAFGDSATSFSRGASQHGIRPSRHAATEGPGGRLSATAASGRTGGGLDEVPRAQLGAWHFGLLPVWLFRRHDSIAAGPDVKTFSARSISNPC
jgi:hypothetical protein